MFKPVKTRNTIDIKKGDVGETYTGIFKGSRKIDSFLGTQVIWEFSDDSNEKPFGIFGFSNLNFQMEHVSEGALVRITYKGRSAVKNKYGKFPHQVSVEIDDGKGEGEGEEGENDENKEEVF